MAAMMVKGGIEHLDTMDTLKIFLSAFWPAFIGALIGSLVVYLGCRAGYDSRFLRPSLNPKSFAELAGYSKEEQKRLLHEASTEAFRHWRGYFPVSAYLYVIATGIAVAHTLPKVTTIPSSLWFKLAVLTVFVCLGRLAQSHLDDTLPPTIFADLH